MNNNLKELIDQYHELNNFATLYDEDYYFSNAGILGYEFTEEQLEQCKPRQLYDVQYDL
jgi:hypothetical protein